MTGKIISMAFCIALIGATPGSSQQPTRAQLDSIYPEHTLEAEELVFRAWAQTQEKQCDSGLSFRYETGGMPEGYYSGWSVGWHDGDFTWDRGDGPMKPPYTDRTWVFLEDLPTWMVWNVYPPQPQLIEDTREMIDKVLLPSLKDLYALEGMGREFFIVPWSRFCT